jgi:protein phosphatase
MIATPAARRFDRSHSSTGLGLFPQLKTLFSERWESIVGPESVAIRAGSRSVTGTYRERNEDRCVVDVERGVFLVVDGVGGHYGGAEASEILAGVLPDWLAATARCAWQDVDLIESAVADAVEAARKEMIELANTDPEFGRMAATMAFALVVDRTLYVTRIGDCRAYLLHRGRLQRLTKDQTFVVAAIDAGLLTEETARDHVWRHVVTNTVGVKPLDEPIEVDEFDLSARDRLLLCSDGLTDVVSDEELQEFLSLGCDPRTTADALVKLALDHDSHDNVTCVVVDLVAAEAPVSLRSVAVA